MGWFGDLLKGIVAHEAHDMIFVSGLPLDDAPSDPFVADECYVELYVDSLRIEHDRKFATSFHGVVYTFATLARRGEGSAQIAAISKPQKIAQLDQNSVGKVITVSKQMVGAVPWRGGQLKLEAGLFSVKSGNVLTPFVNFVTKVSETAGISFVGAIRPFVPLISEGMELLAGQQGETQLEVGVDTTLTLDRPMACAIIAAPRGSIDIDRLSVSPRDHKLLLAGDEIRAGYCVFSIRRSDRKPDFGEIPDLKEKYAAFYAAVERGVEKEASDALAAFRRAATLSPDLISADARLLVKTAEQMMTDAFGGGPIAAAHRGPIGPATLADIPLLEVAK